MAGFGVLRAFLNDKSADFLPDQPGQGCFVRAERSDKLKARY
jgi:hypothetical protein